MSLRRTTAGLGKSAVVAIVMLLALLLTPVLALADSVTNTVDGSPDPASVQTEDMRLVVGTAGATNYYVIPENNDGKQGCNLTGDRTLKVDVRSSNAGVATVSPTSLTFTACNQNVPVTVTPVAAGTATITLLQTSNDTGATFDLTYATFKATVTAPAPSDTTPPVIAPVLSPAQPDGADDWYRGTVSLGWTVSDPESAVSSQAGCGATNVTEDQGERTYTCTATSAGGTGSRSVTIKRDATPPSIAFDGIQAKAYDFGAVPTKDAIACAATDALSGVPAGGCVVDASGYRAEVGGPYKLTATATDNAGNTSTRTLEYTVVDPTAPVVEADVVGTKGENGWYTSDVKLTWTIADTESPYTIVSGCEPKTITADQAATAYPCVVKSAGGQTERSASIQRDASKPAIAVDVKGTKGNGNWYTSDVDLTWEVVAPGPSGLKGGARVDCDATRITEDQKATEYTCTATSGAGLSNSGTVSIKRDATKPVVEAVLEGTAGDEGWFTSDVALRWKVTETGSGVASTDGCQEALVKEDGETPFACTVTDEAGLSSGTATVTVKRDTAAPAITPKVVGDEGENGWYTSDVVLTWEVAGGPSGLKPGNCGATTISEDQEATKYTCAVTSGAGLKATETVTIKRDATAPTDIVLTGNIRDGDVYRFGSVPERPACAADGAISGLASCEVTGYGRDLGVHTLVAEAVDNAGNAGEAKIAYRVKDATPPTIAAVLDGPRGDNDWYVGDVALRWVVKDDESEVAGTVGCDAVRVTEDQEATKYTCEATSEGGTASESVTIKRDATKPAVVATVDGREGNNRWYTGDVRLTWDVAAGLSGLKEDSVVGCERVVVDRDQEATEYACKATSGAGLEASDSVRIKRDATAPTSIAFVGGIQDGDVFGLGNLPAKPDCDADGAVSGLDGCVVTGYGTGRGEHTLTATATDKAGNEGTTTIAYRVKDTTPPTVAAKVGGDKGNNGWYTSDVQLNWVVKDEESDVTTDGCRDVSIAADQEATTYTCVATSEGGESKEMVTIKRDATKPEVALRGALPNATVYYHGFVPSKPDCDASDAMSGIAGCDVSGYGTPVGTHTVVAEATDNAGNVARGRHAYEVKAWTLKGFTKPVDMGGVFNTVKAGSTVPIKFEVFADAELTNPNVVQKFSVNSANCDSGAATDPIEITTSGGTSLRYDDASGQFVQNWKTPTERGCYKVTVETQDGSTLVALFKVTK